MATLDRNAVVLTWLMRGIEDFFVAFSKFDEPFSRYMPFFNAMGFEMVAKAYLLATKATEYEGRRRDEAIRRIDEVARKLGRNLKDLTKKIEGFIEKERVDSVLKLKFDGFTGSQLLDVLEAAYLESRYPVPNPIHKKFPRDEKRGHFREPLFSSGLSKFCYAFSRELLTSLKADFGITITRSILNERVFGEAGMRFCTLFFADKISDFVVD